MKSNQEIFKTFAKQAGVYSEVAVIQREIGTRLFERLSYLKMKPRVVLDLGCGSGLFTEALRVFYPDAIVIGLDRVRSMLRQQGSGVLVEADMQALPFQDGSIDLVFANQVIHWSPAVEILFREVQRVLCIEGCFMFSTLGPDTFCELQSAFAQADDYSHIHAFLDMHHVGDALLAQQFIDPVIDREDIVLHYASLKALLSSLKAQGVRNIHPSRRAGLMGKEAWQQFETAYQQHLTENGKAPLTYEVVYGQAWKGQTHAGTEGVETWISLDSLKKSEERI